MEQKILSVEPRRILSNEFEFQTVKLASQLGTSVARTARERDINDNLLFKWPRLWQNEGRVSRCLPVTTSSGASVESLPVKITPDEQKEPMTTLTPLLSIPSQSTVSASPCKVEFRHGNMTLGNPLSELLTVLIRELIERGR